MTIIKLILAFLIGVGIAIGRNEERKRIESSKIKVGQNTMSKWYTRSCEFCGCDINIHKNWDNPPRICKSCEGRI